MQQQIDGNAAIDGLAADYWASFLEAEPLFATSIGDRRFDDRLPDPSPSGTEARHRTLTRQARRLDALPADGLDERHRMTRLALREVLASDLATLDTGLGDWNVDPVEGVPAGLLLVPDYQRLETPGDGRRMVARWRAMAELTDAHIANLRRSRSAGRVACRAPVERAVAGLAGLLALPDEAWPLLAPLATLDRAAGWSTADRERFADALRAAVRDDVRPAFFRLHAALGGEILPLARAPDRPGMAEVPGGLDGYGALVRAHTSLDLDPGALHRIGLDEIARIDGELDALARRTIGTTSLPDALTRLRADPALSFTTRDEVFRQATTALERANAAIPDWFGRLPRAGCVVVRMGAHEEAHSTIAYYRQPSVDGSRPGQYFINTAEPHTRPRYEAEALAYHEAVPGHHLQITIAQELPQLPDFQRHLGSTAFVEGWGLYAERLADEMGLYTGDLDRIGVLSFDAWRAARLVVDTGMHALGWSRDRALAFMHEHTALAGNNIANEIDRYIVMPGQALAYKMGQLELLRLRGQAMARLGGAFDIRAFHDLVLGNGAIPLAALRDEVQAWIVVTGR